MKCPVCDVALSMTFREGIEIDYCQSCRGVWLDRGELDKLLELAARPAVAAQRTRQDDDSDDDDDRWRSSDRVPRHDGTPYRKREGFWSSLFDFD